MKGDPPTGPGTGPGPGDATPSPPQRGAQWSSEPAWPPESLWGDPGPCPDGSRRPAVSDPPLQALCLQGAPLAAPLGGDVQDPALGMRAGVAGGPGRPYHLVGLRGRADAHIVVMELPAQRQGIVGLSAATAPCLHSNNTVPRHRLARLVVPMHPPCFCWGTGRKLASRRGSRGAIPATCCTTPL